LNKDDNFLKKYRKFSPALFGIAIISFFFPFLGVSCSGQEITYSGMKLILSITDFQEMGNVGNKETMAIFSIIMLLIALISAIIGLWASFKNFDDKYKYLGILGIIGVAGLLIFIIVLDAIKSPYANIDTKIGFWLSLISFSAAGFVNFYYHSLYKKGEIETLTPEIFTKKSRPVDDRAEDEKTTLKAKHKRGIRKTYGYLRIISAPPDMTYLKGDTFPVNMEVTLIGRNPNCDIELKGDRKVSRNNSLLYHSKGVFQLEDRSTNGTFIKPSPESSFTKIDRTEIKPGYLIRVGEHYILRLELPK
jgi:uncharacterized membrane protein YiaA